MNQNIHKHIIIHRYSLLGFVLVVSKRLGARRNILKSFSAFEKHKNKGFYFTNTMKIYIYPYTMFNFKFIC